MNYLNYEFFDEFKSLDSLCRDIYGKSSDNKLGVTMYLDDMDKQRYYGSLNVPGWMSDYKRLKAVRNLRNELAHSKNSFSVPLCSNEDIDFVRSLKKRIMTQTDPLALLRKIDERPRASSHTHTDVTHRPTQEPHASVSSRRGCFGFAALLLFIIICLIVVLN